MNPRLAGDIASRFQSVAMAKPWFASPALPALASKITIATLPERLSLDTLSPVRG